MKAITAMIQPYMLSKVTTALEAIEDFPGMVVSAARGLVREIGLQEQREPRIDEVNWRGA